MAQKQPPVPGHRRLDLQLRREAVKRLPDIAYKDIYLKILEGGYSKGNSQAGSGSSPGLKLKGVDPSTIEWRGQEDAEILVQKFATAEKRLQGQDDWGGEGEQTTSMTETGKANLLPKIGSFYVTNPKRQGNAVAISHIQNMKS